MGLRVTHDCWDGGYSAFMLFRKQLCRTAYGEPYEDVLRERSIPEDDALKTLLTHSDCDGEIAHKDCKPLAERLLELAPKMGAFEAETRQFAFGLACAHEAGENVEFH